MKQLLRWPLKQFLRRAYIMMVDQAREEHGKSMQMWASLSAFGKAKPPKMPGILRRWMNEQ